MKHPKIEKKGNGKKNKLYTKNVVVINGLSTNYPQNVDNL